MVAPASWPWAPMQFLFYHTRNRINSWSNQTIRSFGSSFSSPLCIFCISRLEEFFQEKINALIWPSKYKSTGSGKSGDDTEEFPLEAEPNVSTGYEKGTYPHSLDYYIFCSVWHIHLDKEYCVGQRRLLMANPAWWSSPVLRYIRWRR
jgi:hypothetical protein